MLRCIVFVFICCFTQSFLNAQSFGGNPASIKWRQVNTPYAKVVFPRGLDSAANRVAAVTERLMTQPSGGIGKSLRKVTIILQSNNTISNAYVQLAPYRSEFYLTPPQDPFGLGSMRWVDNLAVHEWRHVEQNSNFNHGLSKVFSFLAGEMGQTFANSLAVPDWFYEGDAVWNETAFSRQGRGRLPQNFNPYKSLSQAGYHYSYMKLRNGSFKNYVPNHYDLGYLFVTYGRDHYGDDIWQKISGDAVRFKGLFYPWQKAVKRNTGVSNKTFTGNAFGFYNKQFQQEESIKPTWITPKQHNNVLYYKYPYPADNNRIIVLKQSYRQLPAFTALKADGSEEKIAVKDIGYEDYFSYRNGRITYTAFKPDARYSNRDFSVIRVLDVKTGKAISVGEKGKYFSPDINENGDKIVAVEANPSSNAQLLLLNIKGKQISAYTADRSYFYSHPKFLNDTTIIVAVRTTGGSMGWLTWHVLTGTSEWLLSPRQQVIGFPVVINDSLYYSGTAGQSDALFVLPLQPGSVPAVVAIYPTGIYQGFAVDGRVTGSVFTADGYRLGTFPWQPRLSINDSLVPLYAGKSFDGKPDVTAAPVSSLPAKSYSKTSRLFNIHSWLPDATENEFGITFYGDNVLNTMSTQLSYHYNLNETSHKAGASLFYGGWYVQPYTTITQTWSRKLQYSADTVFSFDENEATLGLRLPLNLSFGKAYRYLTLDGSYTNSNVQPKGELKDLLSKTNLGYITATARYTVQIQKALQQIYPRYAETYAFTYQRAVNNATAWQWLLNGALYLPGFARTHNFVITAAYQSRDTLGEYVFDNNFPFSRGYESINFPRMFRLGFNYHFPLFYPDWGFGNIVYFRRIRMNGFYDYTMGKSLRSGITYPFNTVGGECYFDTKWWNQLPLTIGVRYSRLLDENKYVSRTPNQWQIILPVNLFP